MIRRFGAVSHLITSASGKRGGLVPEEHSEQKRFPPTLPHGKADAPWMLDEEIFWQDIRVALYRHLLAILQKIIAPQILGTHVRALSLNYPA